MEWNEQSKIVWKNAREEAKDMSREELESAYRIKATEAEMNKRAYDWTEKWYNEEQERHAKTLGECGRLEYEVEELEKLLQKIREGAEGDKKQVILTLGFDDCTKDHDLRWAKNTLSQFLYENAQQTCPVNYRRSSIKVLGGE